ncbi:toll/interleukin-1 receptor domain-containing protein [Butyrivibrio sp. INlla14]|uniref:toll/interleukin-1 receptor domain-containing protein n=1 Tax=Butyrivibrio sp. INlla14 TaxID=1520808 RepID=UPI000AD096C7|nr:toll/interleukin-1 receptor domain-containing protein [Butyrivibrio sp. INlla14]
MINNYNAFISYKHAALDNKIAEEIIKRLERYHIPKNIQKSTGHKKIDRIFRDKDELPITNDLNDTISSALANSDYLIVICSTNTKKSTWVEKEIEIFLKNHTKNQVLTVLADGEPYDVIPQILLSDKKTFQDDNGNYQTVEVPLEPLSLLPGLPDIHYTLVVLSTKTISTLWKISPDIFPTNLVNSLQTKIGLKLCSLLLLLFLRMKMTICQLRPKRLRQSLILHMLMWLLPEPTWLLPGTIRCQEI